MKHTRRDFIKFGGMALGLLPALTAVQGFGRTDLTPNALTLQNADSFRHLIGTEFTFYRTNSATMAGVLTEVGIYQTARQKTGGECFSLVFEMPSDDFGQDSYEIFHPSVGKFELLSVPGKSAKEAPLLIAVINRL